MAQMIWLKEAQADVERLYMFLHGKNPKAANKILALFKKGSEQLVTFPEIGTLMDDETERRELFLRFGSGAYVLRYKITENKVVIIRVWHSREHRD